MFLSGGNNLFLDFRLDASERDYVLPPCQKLESLIMMISVRKKSIFEGVCVCVY